MNTLRSKVWEMGRALHVCEVLGYDQSICTDQGAAGGSNSLLAVRCQWQLCDSSMSAIQRPLRLTVPDDEDSWCCHRRCGRVFRVG